MKKQVFKWTAVACLLTVSIVCAYLYNALQQNTGENPLPEDSLPTVQTPAPTPTPKTDFPKLPLLSPVSQNGFLQNFGGSGEDSVLDCKVFGNSIFVIGHSSSADYDFSSPCLFVAKLTPLGLVEKILELKDSTFLSSTLTETGLVLCYKTENSAKISYFNENLDELYSFPLLKYIVSANFLKTSDFLYLLCESQNTLSLFRFSSDGREHTSLSFALDGLCSTVGFSFVFERLIFLANHNSFLTFFVLDKNLSLLSQKTFSFSSSFVAQSAIPAFFDQDVGFAVTAESEGYIHFLGVKSTGTVAFSTRLSQAEQSYLLRTQNGDYLAFLKVGDSSSATKLCSHGDILEQNVLSLSGYFPKDFSYQNGSLVLLLSSLSDNGTAIATYSNSNTVSFSYSFPSTEPVRLNFLNSNGLLLSLNATANSPNFSSCHGKTDGFLLNLY